MSKIRLVVMRHPFKTEKTILEQETDKTFRALREELISLDFQALVICNDKKLSETELEGKPVDGDHVIIRALPGDNAADQAGGVSAGLGVGAIIVGIILTATGYGAVAGIPLIIGGALTLAGGIGVAFLPELIALSTPKTSDTENKARPYLRGARNTANPWGAIPVVFGKHLLTPYYGASPYTSLSGQDQYLHLMFIMGYKPLSFSDYKIGETLLSNYSGVTTKLDDTTDDIFPNIVKQEDISIEVLKASPLERSTPPKTDKIEVEISFPYGLGAYNSEGNLGDRTVNVKAWYKASSSETWLAMPYFTGSSYDITGSELKQIRYVSAYEPTSGEVSTNPSKTWDVKVERVTDDSTDSKVVDKVYFSALRNIIYEDPISTGLRSRVHVLALKIKASDQLNNIVDQFNCIAEAKALEYSGSGSGFAAWTADTSTRNPASMMLLALMGPANARPIPSSKIDWPEFEDLWTWCDDRGLECNGVYDDDQPLKAVIAALGQTCRSSLTKKDFLYSLVRDVEKTVPVQFITPRNSRDFSGSKMFKDLPHALRINFINEEIGYQWDECFVYYDGYSEDGAGGTVVATKIEELTINYLTNYDAVWKEGRYRLAVAYLRPETWTVTLDFEHLVCNRGSLVRFSHDVPLLGLTWGRLKAVALNESDEATGFITDEVVTMEEDKDYAIQVRASDGSLTIYPVTTFVGSSNSVILTEASEVVPEAGDLFGFGELGEVSLDCLVAAIERGDDLTAKLTLVEYAPAVHTADSATIPAHESHVSIPANFNTLSQMQQATTYDPAQAALAKPVAVAYKLIVDAASINRSPAGTYTPATLGISSQVVSSGSSPVAYAGRFKIAEYNGSTWTDVYTSSGNEATKTHTPSAGIFAVRVRLYLAGGTSSLLDEQIITITFDGQDGDDGDPGDDGLTPFIIFTRSASLPATPAGNDPAGWYDTPPSGSSSLWLSKGVKNSSGVLQGTWSLPVLLTDSIAWPSDEKLLNHFSFDNVPEIPDGGAVYFQDLWTTVDGWSGSDLSLSAEDGNLHISVTGSVPYIFRPIDPFGGSANRKIRLKFRQTNGDLINQILIFYATTGHGISGSYYRAQDVVMTALGNWIIVDIDMSDLTVGGSDWVDSAINLIRIDMPATGGTDQEFDVDWIFIGTGTYTTKLAGGLPLTIAGPSPQPGISGRGLRFSGRDSLYLNSMRFLLSTLTVSFWLKRTETKAGYEQLIGQRTNFDATSKWSINLNNSESNKTMTFWNGNLYFYDYVPPVGQWIHACVVLSPSKNELYINGELKKALAAYPSGSNPEMFYIGGLTPTEGLRGELDEIRIYNAELNAAEINGLYRYVTKPTISHVGRYLGDFDGLPTGEVDDWFLYTGPDITGFSRGSYYVYDGATWVVTLKKQHIEFGIPAQLELAKEYPALYASSAFIVAIEALALRVQSATSGARVEILREGPLGLRVKSDDATDVLRAYVDEDGVFDAGDVVLGDLEGPEDDENQGLMWDKSTGRLILNGSIDSNRQVFINSGQIIIYSRSTNDTPVIGDTRTHIIGNSIIAYRFDGTTWNLVCSFGGGVGSATAGDFFSCTGGLESRGGIASGFRIISRTNNTRGQWFDLLPSVVTVPTNGYVMVYYYIDPSGSGTGPEKKIGYLHQVSSSQVELRDSSGNLLQSFVQGSSTVVSGLLQLII